MAASLGGKAMTRPRTMVPYTYTLASRGRAENPPPQPAIVELPIRGFKLLVVPTLHTDYSHLLPLYPGAGTTRFARRGSDILTYRLCLWCSCPYRPPPSVCRFRPALPIDGPFRSNSRIYIRYPINQLDPAGIQHTPTIDPRFCTQDVTLSR
jgi:hypothetical protein